MRTMDLPIKTLLAGILSIAVGACGSSETDDAVGTTGGTPASGGAAAGGTGGSLTTGGTGQTATGGTPSTGGSTTQPGTGGTPSTGGSTVQPVTGGTSSSTGGTTGSVETGGAQTTGGREGMGGRTGFGGRSGGGADGGGSGGASASGGAQSGGAIGSGGEMGGRTGIGGRTGVGGGATTGGASATGGATGTGGTTGGGTCTASKSAGSTLSGSGSHKVVMETNTDSDVKCGTIYRPEDLGGAEKYPIFVWGEGACSRNGTSNQAAMAEIASHGYFVVADGPPNGGGGCESIGMSSDVVGMAKPLLGYITWAIAENGKGCSAYYQSLDTTKIAADGFSCGGLMAEGTAGDPRMTTWGITSSGLTSANQAFYKTVHTPAKILVGGTNDQAYPNGSRDYDSITALGIPAVFFSKNIGHGGDLGGKTGNGGDFTKINLAWLNWQLKGDETATGKGFLVGDSCPFCKDSAWEVKSANLP